MTFKPSARLAVLLSLLAAAFSGIVVAVEIADDDTVKVTAELRSPSTERQVAVNVPGPTDQVISIDRDTERDAGDVDASLSTPVGEGLDLHEDAVDETPPGITAEEVSRGYERTEDLAERTLLEPQEPAGAQAYSCRSRPVVNQSALSSRRVGVALHFTVSSPGSINAIHDIFNRPSFGASSNYGIELDGECQQWVPEGRKAWAQGAANSAYVSIEIVTNDLSRSQWLATPILRKGILAALVRDIARRHGAPLRRVDPVGCVWSAGIVDHDSLECGNSHWDVGPGFPWDVFIKQVRQGVSVSYSTERERILIRRLRKGTNPRRTCRLARHQLRRLRPPFNKKRHQGSRRRALVRPYAKRCR
jgi:N-acetyl-anhydromuramyl-L-alanine amidase AmpD